MSSHNMKAAGPLHPSAAAGHPSVPRLLEELKTQIEAIQKYQTNNNGGGGHHTTTASKFANSSAGGGGGGGGVSRTSSKLPATASPTGLSRQGSTLATAAATTPRDENATNTDGNSNNNSSTTSSNHSNMATALNKIHQLLKSLEERSAGDHGMDSPSKQPPKQQQQRGEGDGAIGGVSLSVPCTAEGETHNPQQTRFAAASPSFALSTLIPNALITTHIASTLFILLDVLASTTRASWGSLYVYNDTIRKLVLITSCGQRYARPGSVQIAVSTNHFQPSLAGAAAAAANASSSLSSPHKPRPPNGTMGPSSSPHHHQSSSASAANTVESHVLETGIGVNVVVGAGGGTGILGAASSSSVADNTAAMNSTTSASSNSAAGGKASIMRNVESRDMLFHARELSTLLSPASSPASLQQQQSKSQRQNPKNEAATNGSTTSPDSPTTAAASSSLTSLHDTKVRLSTEVAKAHRTRTMLVLPIFKPSSHNTEVMGLLELGNKLGDDVFTSASAGGVTASSLTATVPFSESDECRAVECCAMIANILAKYQHSPTALNDLAHRNAHAHGINDKLALLLSGVPTTTYDHLPEGHPQQRRGDGGRKSKADGDEDNSTGQGKGSNSNFYFNYFGASVLRTSAVRTPQLIYRSEHERIASIKKSDMRANSALVSFKGGADEWREQQLLAQQQQQQQGGSASASATSAAAAAAANVPSSSSTASSPSSPALFTSAQQPPPILSPPYTPPLLQNTTIQPPAYLPQLPTGATVTDAIEYTHQMGEGWRNAVLLNVELETETRRLHEALRISRREVARLQEMVLSMRRAGHQQQQMLLQLYRQNQEQQLKDLQSQFQPM